MLNKDGWMEGAIGVTQFGHLCSLNEAKGLHTTTKLCSVNLILMLMFLRCFPQPHTRSSQP